MMTKLAFFLIFSSLIHSSLAHIQSLKFPGYGFSWYDPDCGYACFNAISGATLTCTSMDSMGGNMDMSASTSPECRASDTPFLTTLAYCMNSTCDPINVPIWKREKYWAEQVTGDPTVLPKWTYSRALEEVSGRPAVAFNSSSTDPLNQTELVRKETYDIQSNFNVLFDHLESLQATYAFVLITIGFGTPIFFTLLGRLPFMSRLLDQIKPYLVYPSSIGTYCVRPLPWLLGNAPTIGQALYIFMFFALNLILCSVNYSRSQPMPWGFGPKEELLAYIGYRTGHISFALLPLVILFSGRNNFLLWITNWPFSTYILLHRWIARIFAIQAIVHSITLLLCFQGSGSYPSEHTQPYWLWGIVATVLTCFMLVLSHLYFRRLAYEFFLILHILMAVFIIAGCWYHVVLRFDYNFYENWLFAACAVWFFDRLSRVLRMARNGVQRAVVTEIGSNYVRVDIDGVRWASKPGYVSYAYFPTLNSLRPWENHPFTCNSTALFRSYKHTLAPVPASESASASVDHSSSDDERDLQKSETKVMEAHVIPTACERSQTTTGVTFFIKKSKGLTRLLEPQGRLLTLLDGPYRQNSSSEILDCDHLLLIGGGIGITALIAWIRAHPNVKLAWSVKANAAALVKDMDVALRDVADKEVVVGERLSIETLLRSEADAGYKKVGVVVCGPGGMCDAVRAAVAGFGRGGKTVFELEVHAFSW